MISLDEYKKSLVNKYMHEVDNSEEKRQERSIRLSNRYNDVFLQKIIDDSYDFIKDVFSSETIQDGYCYYDLEEDRTSYILLGLSGGWFTDVLITDKNEKIISRLIMRQVFGNQFDLYIKEKNKKNESSDNGYSLYMVGFPDNMSEIKQKLFGKKKQLINKYMSK